jgi:hypothetical protein
MQPEGNVPETEMFKRLMESNTVSRQHRVQPARVLAAAWG